MKILLTAKYGKTTGKIDLHFFRLIVLAGVSISIKRGLCTKSIPRLASIFKSYEVFCLLRQNSAGPFTSVSHNCLLFRFHMSITGKPLVIVKFNMDTVEYLS